jgi:hypothetical protein
VLYFTLVVDRPVVGLLAGSALVAVGAYFAVGDRVDATRGGVRGR